jgi:hypothetical protein
MQSNKHQSHDDSTTVLSEINDSSLASEVRHAGSVEALRIRRYERISGLVSRELAVSMAAFHSEMRWLTCKKVERKEKERRQSHILSLLGVKPGMTGASKGGMV